MPKDSNCPADNGGVERIRHRLLPPSLADLALLASFGSGSGEESKSGAGRQHHAWRRRRHSSSLGLPGVVDALTATATATMWIQSTGPAAAA